MCLSLLGKINDIVESDFLAFGRVVHGDTNVPSCPGCKKSTKGSLPLNACHKSKRCLYQTNRGRHFMSEYARDTAFPAVYDPKPTF